MDLENMRENYVRGELRKNDLPEAPFDLFDVWLKEAQEAEISEPNAMTLATATLDGKPSARIVLLKGVSDEGFIFYTNYQSRKAEELAKNPQAALLFLWKETERQVRIEGVVRKISEARSVAYFNTRPKGSQMGALASDQSRPIASRDLLDEKLATVEAKYVDFEKVNKPLHWGGYILTPTHVEFWQGRKNRMHDRILYSTKGDLLWEKTRLQP